MSTYTETIDKHPIHQSLEKLYSSIQDALKVEDLPIEGVEILARITLIKTNFEESLAKCDKNLISTSWLNDANKACESLNNYINTYKSNKDTNSFKTNCNSQIDLLLKSTVNLNCVKSTQSMRGANTASQSYIEAMEAYMSEFYKKVNSYDAEVENLGQKISNNDDVAQMKLKELTNSINAEKQRLDSFANTYQMQMNEDKAEFTKMKDSFEKVFSGSQEEQKLESEKLIAGYKERFDEYEQQTKNLVGIISGNTFSFRYREVADKSRTIAFLWHFLQWA